MSLIIILVLLLLLLFIFFIIIIITVFFISSWIIFEDFYVLFKHFSVNEQYSRLQPFFVSFIPN